MAHINITPRTYNARSKEIPFSKLHKDLADTHGEMPMYLEFYGQDDEITEVVDLYLSKVNQFMANPPKPKPTPKPKPKPAPKPTPKPAPKPVIVEDEKGFLDYVKDPAILTATATGLVVGLLLGKNGKTQA